MSRVKEIYPRYLVAEPTAGPDGLTLRGFRDGTPYQGEELVFEQQAPEHFLARCSRKGVVNSGNCLLERRIGNADLTFRFPRAWLKDWKSVAAGIDRLHGEAASLSVVIPGRERQRASPQSRGPTIETGECRTGFRARGRSYHRAGLRPDPLGRALERQKINQSTKSTSRIGNSRIYERRPFSFSTNSTPMNSSPI